MGNGGLSKLVVVISFLFFIIAFGLALGSEFKRSKVTKIDHNSDGTLECYYSGNISSGLAIAAVLVLAVAQLFVAISTRCLCCATSAYKSGAAHVFAIVAFVLSWKFHLGRGPAAVLGPQAPPLDPCPEVQVQNMLTAEALWHKSYTYFPSHQDLARYQRRSHSIILLLPPKTGFYPTLFLAVAFFFLIVGAIANHLHISSATTCDRLKSTVFAIGAAFTFLTMLMSILYYILISKASISAVPYGAGGPAYGGQGNPPSVGLATYA